MSAVEGRGRRVEEAVDAALIELKESRRNVDIKVISETAEGAVVEVTVIDHEATAGGGAAASPANGKGEIARGLVEGLLKHMGVRAQAAARPRSHRTPLDISGRYLGALTGWRG